MADYERLLGIIQRVGIPYETSETHEYLKIGPTGGTVLTFDSWGRLVSWEVDSEETHGSKTNTP